MGVRGRSGCSGRKSGTATLARDSGRLADNRVSWHTFLSLVNNLCSCRILRKRNEPSFYRRIFTNPPTRTRRINFHSFPLQGQVTNNSGRERKVGGLSFSSSPRANETPRVHGGSSSCRGDSTFLLPRQKQRADRPAVPAILIASRATLRMPKGRADSSVAAHSIPASESTRK